MPIRLSTRAVIVHQAQLLLVNAYPDGQSDLWCAPGGGAEPGQSLPDNLKREVFEETGLDIHVGAPCLINEFHDPDQNFHQVDIFFRCQIQSGALSDSWRDPEGIVTSRRFFDREALSKIRLKPDCLIEVAYSKIDAAVYDPLERLLPP